MISDMMAAYLGQGDILGALAYFMGNYPIQGFGVIWALMGTIMYAVLFAKTRDYGICGLMLTVYLAMVSQFFDPSMWVIFIVVLALHGAIMLRKVIVG